MPRSPASPGVNMSSVDRLSMPKERSKGMELTGYTLLERLREMRDIMKVKGKRFADELLQNTYISLFLFRLHIGLYSLAVEDVLFHRGL